MLFGVIALGAALATVLSAGGEVQTSSALS
jgi:hypothetical protein